MQPHTHRIRAAALVSIGALLLLWAGAIGSDAAQDKKPPVFIGYCTPDAGGTGGGTCTLDEPEGQNPDTYGTVTYSRTVAAGQDSLAFDLPDGLNATEVQVCLTLADSAAANPYGPTNANTCAGNSPDRAYQSNSPPDPVVIDVDAFFAGDVAYAVGDPCGSPRTWSPAVAPWP